MTLEQFIQHVSKSIEAAKTPLERIEVIARLLGTAFSVDKDEVAIFTFDKSREVLVFIWPNSLKSIGSIPMNAHNSLVAKTAVEKKGGLDNSFASTPHLYMFEHFLSQKEKRVPIQKIMSVPVMSGSDLKGVIQVARKGADRESAGADFTANNLASLATVAGVFADYL